MVRIRLAKWEAVARQTIDIVEIVIRIKSRRAVLPETAAMEFRRSRLSYETNLNRAFAAAFSSRHGGRNGDFLDRVSFRLHLCEEPIRTAQEVVLNIRPVQRQVHGAFWQSIDRRCSRHAGRLHAW